MDGILARLWQRRNITNPQSTSILAPGQMGYDSSVSAWKRGDGVTAFSALPYVPRHWTAVATDVLATTNGDGVEKTISVLTIPANTLLTDGNVCELIFYASYFNYTTVSQTPQFGLSLNASANWFMSYSAGQSVASTNVTRAIKAQIRITRASSTTVDIDGMLYMSGGYTAGTGFGTAEGTWDWPNQWFPRFCCSTDVPFICSNDNALKFKMVLAAYGTPSLHQITGRRGRATILNG